jgi:ADP-heptose:LPS heptosyltransferase
VFLHPGSGGSATNLTPVRFAELGARLHERVPHVTVITAGPGEHGVAQRVAAGLGGRPHTVFRSEGGLVAFARHLAFADLFVSGSTGTLHLAGALDRPTAGFYRRRRSSTALRWQTLSAPHHRLEFSPPDDADESGFDRIDLAKAAEAMAAITGR